MIWNDVTWIIMFMVSKRLELWLWARYHYYTITILHMRTSIFTSDFDPTGESEAACPSPLGVRPPPGCKKTFIQDTLGSVSCQDDEDCPESLQWWNDHDQQNICSKPGM